MAKATLDQLKVLTIINGIRITGFLVLLCSGDDFEVLTVYQVGLGVGRRDILV